MSCPTHLIQSYCSETKTWAYFRDPGGSTRAQAAWTSYPCLHHEDGRIAPIVAGSEVECVHSSEPQFRMHRCPSSHTTANDYQYLTGQFAAPSDFPLVPVQKAHPLHPWPSVYSSRWLQPVHGHSTT
jgi:hypothetical protein